MRQNLFEIPVIGTLVPGYGLMLMIGFLTSIWWAARRAYKSGGNPDTILNCGFVAIIAGVVGCRTFFVIHYWPQFAAAGGPWEVFWSVVDVRKGGMEFYGGFVLSAIAIPLWLRLVEKVSVRWYVDIIAPSAALGLSIGRIGCFLNGCCWGGVCDQPWAVQFPYGSTPQMSQWQKKTPGSELPIDLMVKNGAMMIPIDGSVFMYSDATIAARADKAMQAAADREAAPQGSAERNKAQARLASLEPFYKIGLAEKQHGLSVAELRALAHQHPSLPVHPTQLYSMLTALLIALLLDAVYWRRSFDGQVLALLLIIEAPTRWLIETIRADNPHDTFMGLTVSQTAAVLLTLTGVTIWVLASRLPKRSPKAEIWVPEEPAPAKA
ncbi:MAG: prolipoprotein diacylglyceryl transferase [Phycisphaerales bacterium]|nr:prolipoprotein diacylglyceryl transferase [Phycisphaerales bacterium]